MDEKPRGHIKLSRKQFNDEDILWGDKTPFDNRSAWTWLLQAAAWKDGFYHTQFRLDELKRGEFVASLRFLADRWKWSHTRVARFLALLAKAGRIALQRLGQHGTVYLIVNYDTYQSTPAPSVVAGVTPNDTPTIQPRYKVEAVKAVEASNYPPEFELLWKVLPKKPGANKKQTYRLYLGHLRAGVDFDTMYNGAIRYAAYALAKGWIGTDFVKAPQVFMGRDQHFLSEWDCADLPKKPAAVGPTGSTLKSGMIEW